MSEPQSWEGLTLDTPADYRIKVRGALDESWSDRLGGMTITRIAKANAKPVTVLVGRLQDQSALTGVLNALHNLRMPIISVEMLEQ